MRRSFVVVLVLVLVSAVVAACDKKDQPGSAAASSAASSAAAPAATSPAASTPQEKVAAWTKLPPKTFEGSVKRVDEVKFSVELVDDFVEDTTMAIGEMTKTYALDRVKSDLMIGPTVSVGLGSWEKDVDTAAAKRTQTLSKIYETKVLRKEKIGDAYVYELSVGEATEIHVSFPRGKDSLDCTGRYREKDVTEAGAKTVGPWLQKMCLTLKAK